MPSGINYTTFFTGLGRFVKQYDTFNALQTSLLYTANSGLQDILPQYAGTPNLVAGLDSKFNGFASSAAQWESTLQTFVNGLLANLQQPLNAPSNDPTTILNLMIPDMAASGATLNRNTTSCPGSGTAASTNVGSGILIAMANNSQGYPDERIISEAVQFTCTNSAFSGGTYGGETFSITGFPAANNPYTVSANPTGSGTVHNFQVSDKSATFNSILNKNPSFDIYSGGTFPSWSTPVFSAPASYTAVYTWVSTAGVESTPSPASTAVAVVSGQAIAWTLPALASGMSGINLYMDNGSGIYKKQYVGLPGGLVLPVGTMVPGSPPPTSSSVTAPTAALAGAAYVPVPPTQDTSRTWPPTGGGALSLSASTAGPVYIMLPLSTLTSFNGAFILAAALAQFSNTSGTSRLTVAIVNAVPSFTVLVDGDPYALLVNGAYGRLYKTFWANAISPNAQILITWNATGAPSGAKILIDSMVLGPSQTFGNVQYFLLRGQSDFVAGDSFSIATVNSANGLFQRFLAQYYGVTVNSSATPTIPDSLIT